MLCDSLAYRHSMEREGQTVASDAEQKIRALLFQSEQVLKALLGEIKNRELGYEGHFYLLLWLRNLLHTFCYGLRLPRLSQWQFFYLELKALLHRYIRAKSVLGLVLRPLHELRLADMYHLHLDWLEMLGWQLVISRSSAKTCSRPVLLYLALLRCPLTHYRHALRTRLRYWGTRLRKLPK